MEKLPILTGEKVVLRPITDADTDNIVRWRNTPRCAITLSSARPSPPKCTATG